MKKDGPETTVVVILTLWYLIEFREDEISINNRILFLYFLSEIDYTIQLFIV